MTSTGLDTLAHAALAPTPAPVRRPIDLSSTNANMPPENIIVSQKSHTDIDSHF